MRQWNLLTQWTRLTKFSNVYLINLKNKNMILKNEYASFKIGHPEYYEYTSSSTEGFTEGKIYKILDPYNLETYFNFIDDQGDTNGFAPLNHRYFKSSTKEAFDKQNNKQNNMEIIGYKSPTQIGTHAKGELYVKVNEDLYIPDSTKDTINRTFYSIPKEIAETWEPVYKETSKTLILGTSRIKVVISKGKIDVDNGNIIDSLQFKLLYQALTNTEIKGFSRSYDVLFPKGVKIGCSEFEVSEIKLIIDTYNEINK